MENVLVLLVIFPETVVVNGDTVETPRRIVMINLPTPQHVPGRVEILVVQDNPVRMECVDLNGDIAGRAGSIVTASLRTTRLAPGAHRLPRRQPIPL